MKSVHIPILIGSPGLDSLVDFGAHERAARLMPHAKLVRYLNAHHGLWFEQDEDYNAWINEVRNFLDQATGPATVHHTARQTVDTAKIKAAFPQTA